MWKCAIAAAGMLGFAGTANADVASTGAQAVELHLIQSGRWAPVRCDQFEYALSKYVFCYPSREKQLGVLYGIADRDGRPVIQPVTGKAKQFMSVRSISAMDGSRVPVENWTGTPGAMEELLQRARR